MLKGRRGTAAGQQASPAVYLSIAMFTFVTLHWAVDLARSFQAFVFFRGGSDPGAFYSDTTQISAILKYGILMVLLMTGDITIIYRLWIIWGHRGFVVVLPISLFVGFLVCAVGLIHGFLESHAGQSRDAFAKANRQWIISLCVFTACTSLYCTSLISWKVWKMERATADLGGRWLAPLRAVTIESAIIYTCWGTFYYTTWQAGSLVNSIASDTLAPITGITFVLINVRMGLRKLLPSKEDV
ncbi:hypothetical protein BD779DRAFT_435971 [Infundibulicybe gibba]|nr:hypothetical protein BD779DRAFT_435971 [Infundibulicybe gibba]